MGYTVFSIFAEIVKGYILSTLLFLIAGMFSPKLKGQESRYLDFANKLALILSICFYISFLALSSKISRESFLFTTIANLVIPLLFVFKSLRQNILGTIAVMLSLLMYTHYEKAVIIITSFYQDYLPSSWSVQYPGATNMSTLAFTAFYFTIVIIGIQFKKNTK